MNNTEPTWIAAEKGRSFFWNETHLLELSLIDNYIDDWKVIDYSFMHPNLVAERLLSNGYMNADHLTSSSISVHDYFDAKYLPLSTSEAKYDLEFFTELSKRLQQANIVLVDVDSEEEWQIHFYDKTTGQIVVSNSDEGSIMRNKKAYNSDQILTAQITEILQNVESNNIALSGLAIIITGEIVTKYNWSILSFLKKVFAGIQSNNSSKIDLPPVTEIFIDRLQLLPYYFCFGNSFWNQNLKGILGSAFLTIINSKLLKSRKVTLIDSDEHVYTLYHQKTQTSFQKINKKYKIHGFSESKYGPGLLYIWEKSSGSLLLTGFAVRINQINDDGAFVPIDPNSIEPLKRMDYLAYSSGYNGNSFPLKSSWIVPVNRQSFLEQKQGDELVVSNPFNYSFNPYAKIIVKKGLKPANFSVISGQVVHPEEKITKDKKITAKYKGEISFNKLDRGIVQIKEARETVWDLSTIAAQKPIVTSKLNENKLELLIESRIFPIDYIAGPRITANLSIVEQLEDRELSKMQIDYAAKFLLVLNSQVLGSKIDILNPKFFSKIAEIGVLGLFLPSSNVEDVSIWEEIAVLASEYEIAVALLPLPLMQFILRNPQESQQQFVFCDTVSKSIKFIVDSAGHKNTFKAGNGSSATIITGELYEKQQMLFKNDSEIYPMEVITTEIDFSGELLAKFEYTNELFRVPRSEIVPIK